MQINQFKLMGVVNITPNSFSDGGKNFDNHSIFKSLKEFNQHDVEVYDFGAESTAPFNEPVDIQEELGRFKTHLFPILDDVLAFYKTISIDTYKPEVFAEVAQKIFSLNPEAKLIWNDVSGIVDSETNKVLSSFPKVTYVLSHNLAPDRSRTSDHMSFVDKDLSLDNVESFFKERLSRLAHKNIMLDPCFGFSKTYDQNWMLINELPKLVSSFTHPWLLGVSKKSFLKRFVAEFGDSYSESLHSLVLSRWAQKLPQGSYFIRLHDAALGQLVNKGLQFLT